MIIFTLGMRHTGAALVSRLLATAGAYFGRPHHSIANTTARTSNAWIRSDISELHDSIYEDHKLFWNRVLPSHSLLGNPKLSTTQEKLLSDISHDLEQHGPAVITEERLGYCLPVWLNRTPHHVVLFVHRHPVALARDLYRNHNIPLHAGIALWEHHTVHALNASRNSMRLCFNYDDLLSAPEEGVHTLLEALRAFGFDQLNDIPSQALKNIIAADPALEPAQDEDTMRFLSAAQQDIHDALTDGSIAHLREELALSPEAIETLENFEQFHLELATQLHGEREEIESKLALLQTQLEGRSQLLTMMSEHSEKLTVHASRSTEERDYLRTLVTQGEDERASIQTQLELQRDKMNIAAQWLERANSYHHELQSSRRWKILSWFASIYTFITGRQSRLETSLRDMRQLEQALLSLQSSPRAIDGNALLLGERDSTPPSIDELSSRKAA